MLSELFSTLARNRLRTLLTGLSVAWGTFMLVLLMGAGRGLQNGIEWEFRDDAVNSIWAWTGLTSLPYAGSGRFYMWGEFSVKYGDRHSAFDVLGIHPDQRYLEKTLMIAGRYVNQRDIDERRKVAVIGDLVRTMLFKDEDPLGKIIQIRGLA